MKLIDLTMPLNNSTPIYPGDIIPEFKKISSLEKDGWNQHRICINNHFGTHIETPSHMIKNGKKLINYSIEKFIGTGVIIDVRGKKKINANLKEIHNKDIIIIRTDHTQKIHSNNYFTSFPTISEEFAKTIVEKKVNIVGIDSFTIDESPFNIHKYFFDNDILCLENLVNLHLITNKSFKIFVLPINLVDMDAAPCRVIAQIE